MGHRISGVESSISENGIANTSVCVPVSGGTLVQEGTAKAHVVLGRGKGMISVVTV